MDRKEEIAIQKMIAYIESAIAFCSDFENYEDFEHDEKTIMASVFAIVQMAEIANSLSKELKEKTTAIPWKNINGIRNHIVHGYDDLDVHVLWDTIKNDLPTLKSQLERI